MTKRSAESFLNDIIQSIDRIETYTKGLNKKALFDDLKTQDAVVRNFEIIGEAVKNLPEKLRKSLPHIPWKFIAGMRDMVIHEYFNIDEETIWKTIKTDLPSFKKEIQKLLK